MFTGIVEATGKIESLRSPPAGSKAGATGDRARPSRKPKSAANDGATGARVSISTDLDLAGIPLGGSIAVDGVCLTVIARKAGRFDADLGPETLSLTTLGQLQAGDLVHLERPLRLGDPLGGHLVAGHVDGVGKVLAARPLGEALELEISPPAELAAFVAPKGSIAIDGVSLTVNRVTARSFSVTLIPHTLAVTRLAQLRPGDRVNLEADLLAKHIARLLGNGIRPRRPRARRERSPSRRAR